MEDDNKNKKLLGNYLLFDGDYSDIKKSKKNNYASRKKFENDIKQKNIVKNFKILEEILENPDDLTEKELDIAIKRYKSLKQYIKVQKSDNCKEQLRIPFEMVVDNKKTIVYIREKNCFRPKWVKLFGKAHIKKRIQEYKSLLKDGKSNKITDK